jgi:DNA polymerase III subunit gamma/tau
VTAEDVSTVLGMVGRDLLLDILEAVAGEQALAAFDLAGRAIESGYDLKILCRELSRVVRDLMLVSVDPKRLDDPEVAPAGERDRIAALVKRFSREDLLRSFDLIARAEVDLRNSAEPRYHLEMALLKWIHLRKLMPLADLIDQLQQGGSLPTAGRPPAAAAPSGASSAGGLRRSLPERAAAPPTPVSRPAAEPAASAPAAVPATRPATRALPPPPDTVLGGEREEIEEEPLEPDPASGSARPVATGPPPVAATPPAGGAQGVADPSSRAGSGAGLRDAFIEEVRRAKEAFYRMTLAQAHLVEVEGDRIVFSFAPARRVGKSQIEKNRTWLEPLAARVAGRRMFVVANIAEPAAAPSSSPPEGDLTAAKPVPPAGPPEDLKKEAAADPGMQTLLELIPLEIKDVERL